MPSEYDAFVYQIALLIIQGLALIIFSVIGYLAVETRKDVKALAASLTDVKVMMVSSFMPLEAFNLYRSEVQTQLSSLSDKMQKADMNIAILFDRIERRQKDG